MAPEWTLYADKSMARHDSGKTMESLKKLDIYALGIIMADLVCNPHTGMEQMKIDENIKKYKLPTGYKLEGTVEGELLMLLVAENPDTRPTIEQIKSEWLPRWKADLPPKD